MHYRCGNVTGRCNDFARTHIRRTNEHKCVSIVFETNKPYTRQG